jgi:tRNA dimethylallyltransferase
LENKISNNGKDGLYQELLKVDPIAAQRIGQHNVRRIIRALEVHRNTGTPISQLQYKEAPPYKTLTIGLTTDRAELYYRIDLRVDGMIKQGLVEEVEKLKSMRYDFNLPAMSGIGYKQVGMFFRGELALATAIQQIKFETHRFAKQQYTWFQLGDNRIRWFDTRGKHDSQITSLVSEFLSDRSQDETEKEDMIRDEVY